MENKDTVMVESMSDHTVVVDVPELKISRTWTKRGQKYPFDRDSLFQAYYKPDVEFLFKEGIICTDDKEFLISVGLMDEEKGETAIVKLTDAYMNRIIKLMPISDVKAEVAKLSETQKIELGEYAVEHYTDLKLDRIDILSKLTHKDLLKAIENYKKAQED